jgi:DNA recombination protein RmuC
MEPTGLIIVLVALILLVLGAWLGAAWLRARLEGQTAALRQEMQGLVGTQVQSVTTQLGQLAHTVGHQLSQVTQTLQHGVANSGMLVSEAQKAVAGELKSSREMLDRINLQLGAVQQAGQELSQAAQTLQLVLGGAKSRGTLGEIGLERLIRDALPRSAYEFQYRFSTGAVVDAIVRSGERLLPIDSKFPLDAYRRLAETGEEARKDFASDVRKHADAIAAKYILPAAGTLDFALMFVASESVYYELLMTDEPRAGRLDEYCRQKGVIPVSPNTLLAYLGVILVGLRGLQVKENIRQLLGELAGLQKQMDGFAELYDKLGTHLRNAVKNYEEAQGRLERSRMSLEQLAQGSLPEGAPAALEPAAKD